MNYCYNFLKKDIINWNVSKIGYICNFLLLVIVYFDSFTMLKHLQLHIAFS